METSADETDTAVQVIVSLHVEITTFYSLHFFDQCETH